MVAFSATFILLQLYHQPSTYAEAPTSIEVTDCIVRFADEVDVPSVESGRIAEVTVTQNQSVDRGSPLARLDDRSLKIRRHASALRLQHAQAEAFDDVEIRYAETALAEAKEELDSNRSIQKDVSGAIPMSHLRRLRLAVERGELEVAQAKKRHQEAAVEVELREADLAMIDDQLSNLQIDSPLSGTVLSINRSPGEWIEKGQPIATIAKIDRLHVHALIREEEMPNGGLKGSPVSVHWSDPSSGQEYALRGRVLSVDPQRLPGSRYRLHAEIDNTSLNREKTQWQLKPGTEVQMKVYIAHLPEQSAELNHGFPKEKLR